MKPRFSRRFLHSPPLRSLNVVLTFASKPLLLAVACSLGAVSLSSAASFTYDANTATAGAQDGAGAGWNTSPAVNWLLNGTGSDLAWSNLITDTAVFGAGGTGGTVVVGTVNVGTIQFNATTTTGYTLSTGVITLGTGIVNNNAAFISTISAKISGSAGLAYSGTGSVTLSGANDYTGTTTLTGTGRISNGGANLFLGSSVGASASALGGNYTQIGTGTGVTFSGGTVAEAFIINGSAQASNGAFRFSNNTTLNSLIQLGGDSLISGAYSGGNVINGNIDLQGFTLSTSNTGGTINGAIIGTGNVSIGANSVFILANTANSFSGNLTLNSTGTVGLGADGVLGTSKLVFASGGIQSTDSSARTIANTIGALTGNAIFGATATQTGTLNFTSTASTSLGTTARTLTTNVNTTIAATLTNTGGLIKAGASTLFLTNTASTRTGATTINAGILNVAKLADGGTGNNSSIGAATNAATNLVLAGGTLQYTGSAAQSTNRLFTVAPGSAGPSNSATIDASGADPAASLVFTNSAAIAQNDLSRAAALPITNTTLTGLASTADLKVGATVTGTGIAAGTTIGSITNSTTIVLSQATTNATAATNTLTFGSVDRTLVLTGTNTGANSIAGALSDKSATAILSVSKTAIGTWALGGTNTYTGSTTISAGTLLINGTNTGSGAVDVGASGKLGGIGTIAGGVNVTGVLSPGASIESLATGTVAFASGSKLTYELQDTSSVGADLVDITGNLSLAGTVTLDLVKLGAGTWAVGDKLTILSYTGSITANSFFNFVDGGDGKLTDDETFSFDGAEWVFDYNDLVAGSNYASESSGNFVTMTVIPEPSAAMLVGGLGVLGLIRRRRNS